MKTERIECTDGTFITNLIPESREDVEKIAKMMSENPAEWGLGRKPETHGEGPGHEYRGNQYDGGIPGDGARAKLPPGQARFEEAAELIGDGSNVDHDKIRERFGFTGANDVINLLAAMRRLGPNQYAGQKFVASMVGKHGYDKPASTRRNVSKGRAIWDARKAYREMGIYIDDSPPAESKPETHGEGPGHAFRGNQYTGGIGGSLGSEVQPSPEAWSSESSDFKAVSDPIYTAQMLIERLVPSSKGQPNVGNISKFLTYPPGWRPSMGPKRWAVVRDKAQRILDLVRKTGLDQDKLKSALATDIDSKYGADYLEQQVARLAAGRTGVGNDAKLIESGLVRMIEIANDGIGASKAYRKGLRERDDVADNKLAESFPGLSEVKIFKTSKAAEDSLSDIAWKNPDQLGDTPTDPYSHSSGPIISLKKTDPRIASLMANELRSLADEFPDDWGSLGRFIPKTRDIGSRRKNVMASYNERTGIHTGMTLSPNEYIAKLYDKDSPGPSDVIFNRNTFGRRPVPPGAKTGSVSSIAFNGALFSSIKSAYHAHGVESASDFHDGMKDIRSTVRHEFGHHIDAHASASGFSGFASWKQKWSGSVSEISGYSKKNNKEFFAEAFAAAKYGDASRKKHAAIEDLRGVLKAYRAHRASRRKL